MYIDLRVKYPCKNLIKLEFSQNIVEKQTNTNFHENPSSGSQFVQCGQTDGQRHMTKLIITFENFVDAPHKSKI